MAKPKIHVYIPSLPQRSYEYRRGDSILIYDDEKHAILIDGGERELFDRMEDYLRKNFTGPDGYAHVTFVLTHWHGDHDCGLRYVIESPHIFVDEIYCPPPEELKLVPRDDGYDEYNRAMKRIALAKDYNKKIIYPAAGKRTGHWVGKIRMWMWRQKANPADFVDYQVNNTSLITYFPDLEFLASGDSITSFDRYLKQYDYRLTGFKIPHHGNACNYATCDLMTEHEARICYYTDWEPFGVAIGGTTFSKYGANRCKQYFVTLRPFNDIEIEADGEGHVIWKQNGNEWRYDIAYGSSSVIPQPDEDTEVIPVIHTNPGFKGYNVSSRSDKIQYIVIHYVGAESTAEDNVKYFNSANRNASADFFIGHNGDIWQYNPDILNKYSWHCGGGRQSSQGGTFYGKCRNGNSVGIELCTKKDGSKWTFSEQTITFAALLVKYLMKSYGIPVENVIRHFDVTGKYCPQVTGWIEPLGPVTEWERFKAGLGSKPVQQIYRVRKEWEDAKSQLGAFSSLDNARAMRDKHEGYHIYDSLGVEVD